MNADKPNIPKPPATYRAMHVVIGPVLKLLGMSCRAAYALSVAKLDRPLTFGESVRRRIHLLVCGLCRRIPTQFKVLQDCTRQACEHDHNHDQPLPDDQLSEESKKRIADTLEKDSRKF